MRTPFLATTVVLLILSTTAAADWPRFRGPNGRGVSDRGALPVALGADDPRAWSTEVPFGRSSPVVFGDRLFITASEDGRLVTLCFSRREGRLLWRHEAIPARTTDFITRGNDPASPTPAVDAGGVYVFFQDLGLLALDHRGRERWRVPLGPFKTAYGLASSPIVVDGVVIQACDTQENSFVLAVDAANGRQRWRVERRDVRAGWYTPIVVEKASGAGQRALVVPGSAHIAGYDLKSGALLWQVAGSGAENLGVPVFEGGYLYVNVRGFEEPQFETWPILLDRYDANHDNKVSREEVKANPRYFDQFNHADVDRDGFFVEAEWTALRNAGVGNFGLTAIRLGSASVDRSSIAWRFQRNLPYVPAPLLYKEIIYLVRSGGIVTAVDPRTGAMLKQVRTPEAPGDYFASPVAGDGKVYITSAEGRITVLKADASLTILKVNDLRDEIYATPALVDGSIFVRTRSRLYCFRDRASGA